MDYNQDNYKNVFFKDNDTITFNYTGNYNAITLNPGIYKIECWGACGGRGYGWYEAGHGGYSRGTLYLDKVTTFFVYPGESGAENDSLKQRFFSFNGGGPFAAYANMNYLGGNGGGASDIRLKEGKWDDLDSLRSRIIVAGGGGGSGTKINGNSTIGHGGGLIGDKSINLGPNNYVDSWSGGGSQVSGGRGENRGNEGKSLSEFNREYVYIGSFGIGAYSKPQGAGGGGGYYGGGSSFSANGGGGSSFISGHEGCNAIDENGNHTNQPNHFSNLIFKDTYMENGLNYGNGIVKITVLSINKILFLKEDKVQYFKDNKFYTLKDKNINNITIDDFFKYGTLIKTEYIGIGNRTILSLENKIDCRMIKGMTILYDPLDKKRFNIRKIKKITINDIGNIKYIIYNGFNFYTWLNNEWGIYNLHDNFSTEDIKNMEKFAVKSDDINQIEEEYWNQLWNDVDSFKNISFLAFYLENYEQMIIENIKIIKDEFINEKQIKSNMLEEINTRDDIQILWKAGNKDKVKIIYN